jgi:carbon monoxide dehydrogenase subunit G
MPKVEKSITINVPIDTVFSMVADEPERMAEWWPPIELQERVSPPPTNIGSVSRYVYNMLGVKIKGEHRVESIQREDHLTVKTISGLDSTFHFQFEPAGANATRLTITVDYQLPGSIVGQLLNKAVIEGENAKNLEKGLENLKGILEEENG